MWETGRLGPGVGCETREAPQLCPIITLADWVAMILARIARITPPH